MGHASDLAAIVNSVADLEVPTILGTFKAMRLNNLEADTEYKLFKAMHDRLLFSKIEAIAKNKSAEAVKEIAELCKQLKIEDSVVEGQSRIVTTIGDLEYTKRVNNATTALDATQFCVELQKLGVSNDIIIKAEAAAMKKNKPATYNTITIIGG